MVLGVLVVLYFSGALPLGQGKPEKKALCWVSPQNPNYIKEVPARTRRAMNWCRSIPPPPGRSPPARPWRPPHLACCGQAQVLGAAPCIRKSSGKSRASARYAAWTWCHSITSRPRRAGATAPAAAPKEKRKIKYWVSPMDPGYVRDKPGKAPCGMDMVPVYEDAGAEAPAGAIAVSPATVQSMGVRTAKVEVRPLTRDTWTVGLVTFDERNLSTINTKVNGWVERLYVNATGDPVRRGQTLLSIYSPTWCPPRMSTSWPCRT